jgi:hypothetical protein
LALRRTLIAVAICGAFAAVGGGIANAQSGDRISSSWAQVNVCSPSQLGARAQLAGDGSEAQMSVSFTAQWLSAAGWVPLGGAAGSPVLPAGSARYTWGQAGWTFDISVPAGFTYQLRAVANLNWSGGRSQTLVTGTCTVGSGPPANAPG